MYRSFLSIILLFTAAAIHAQDPQEILQKAYERCTNVQNGYYEMSLYEKDSQDKGSVTSAFSCYFRRQPQDTLMGQLFRAKRYIQKKYSADLLYTGDALINYSVKTRRGRIIEGSLFAAEIKARKNSYRFYHPFHTAKSHPLPVPGDTSAASNTYRYIGEENINGKNCYHVQMNLDAEKESSDMVKVIRLEYHFWIDKTEYLPLQYSEDIDAYLGKERLEQHKRYTLKNFMFNTLDSDSIFTRTSIPANITLEAYVPYKRPPLLPLDTLAPDWTVHTIDNREVRLAGLRGQLVLIDFFYKTCFPCVQAMPVLERLHNKYKERGLFVIGMDPYDDKTKDNIPEFLARNNVSYAVALIREKLPQEYRVSGYPTLYLIDKEGRVRFIHSGFGPAMEAELEKVIEENL